MGEPRVCGDPGASDTAIDPRCLRLAFGASRGGGGPAGVLQGCSRGGGPPGATATAVHLSDQRAHAGGSSSLGMSPEKKSLIFLRQ